MRRKSPLQDRSRRKCYRVYRVGEVCLSVVEMDGFTRFQLRYAPGNQDLEYLVQDVGGDNF
jgi:hypothetical protein